MLKITLHHLKEIRFSFLLIFLIFCSNPNLKVNAQQTIQTSYYKSKALPIFGEGISKFAFANALGNGTNNYVNTISNVFSNTFLELNRYEASDITTFNNSSNQSFLNASLTKLTFKHNGYDANGRNLGYVCTIAIRLSIKNQYSTPVASQSSLNKTFSAVSFSLVTLKTRTAAFNNALRKLKRKFIRRIVTNHPVQYEITKIETDKKGMPKYIYLKKSEVDIKLSKMSISIVELDGLTLSSDGYSIKETLADVNLKVSKSVGDTFQCKITNKKSKERLSDYIGAEFLLLGVSKFNE